MGLPDAILNVKLANVDQNLHTSRQQVRKHISRVLISVDDSACDSRVHRRETVRFGYVQCALDLIDTVRVLEKLLERNTVREIVNDEIPRVHLVHVADDVRHVI